VPPRLGASALPRILLQKSGGSVGSTFSEPYNLSKNHPRCAGAAQALLAGDEGTGSCVISS
jgi:hypothetical protein